MPIRIALLTSALALFARGADVDLQGCRSFGPQKVKEVAADIAREDVKPPEKRNLYLCLGSVRNKESIEALLEIVATKDEHLAESVGRAITETLAFHPENSKGPVSTLLNSRHAGVRNQAIRLLAEHAWDGAHIPKLKKILLGDADEGNRVAAAYVLAARKITDAKPDLTKALKDKSEAVRGAAQYSLKQLEDAK